MRPDLPELLFYEYDIRDFLEDNLRKAKEYIDKLPENDFLNADDEKIIEHVYSKFEVVPIELNIWYILLLNLGTLLTIVAMLIIPSYLITKISPAKAIRFN